jgi:drug/metabolite transporter (DMT)-like permease
MTASPAAASQGAARFVPHALLTAMIVIWGGSYAAVKIALDALSPFAVIAARFWLALPCLVPFLRGDLRADLERTAGPGLLTGAVLAAGYLLQTVGMRETTASMGGFLAGLLVPLVALGGCVLFHARFGVRSAIGLAFGVGGIALLCWPGDAGEAVNSTFGIAMQIGSMVSYAAHILLLSRFGRGLPALPYCVWQLAVVAIAASIAAAIDGDLGAAADRGIEWTPRVGTAVAYLGVLATALGIAVQSKVQHRIPSTQVALLFALQPLFAALIGWALLGETSSALQLLGGGLIVAGVVVTSLDR